MIVLLVLTLTVSLLSNSCLTWKIQDMVTFNMLASGLLICYNRKDFGLINQSIEFSMSSFKKLRGLLALMIFVFFFFYYKGMFQKLQYP